jgi:WD40 repeat protein
VERPVVLPSRDNLESVILLRVSPDGSRFAYVVEQRFPEAEQDEKPAGRDDAQECHVSRRRPPVQRLVLDGKELGEFQMVHQLDFSPDSKRFAYGVDGALFVDGRELPGADSIASYVVFSPCSRHVAYVVRKWDWHNPESTKYAMMLDENRSRWYQEIEDITPVFSPDGKKQFFRAKDGDMRVFVVNNEEVFRGKGEGHYAFSPAGNRLAFYVFHSDAHVWDGGIRTRGYDTNPETPPLFSPDGSRLACFFMEGDRWLAVVDGVEGKRYGAIVAEAKFSPDSKHFAYGAEDDDGLCLVLDSEEICRGYDGLDELVFSPGGELLAANLCRGDSWFMVVNGQVYWAADKVSPPRFSSDGKHMAFIAVGAAGWRLVLDSTPRESYDYVDASTLEFDPNGSQVSFYAERNTEPVLVAGDREYPVVSRRVRYPKSRHFGPNGEVLYLAPGAGKSGLWLFKGDSALVPNVFYFRLSEDRKHYYGVIDREGYLYRGFFGDDTERRRKTIQFFFDGDTGPAYDSFPEHRPNAEFYPTLGYRYYVYRNDTLFEVTHTLD